MSWSASGGEPTSSWAELERRADAIRDLNGTPIDAGIRPVVVGLWAHGISTDFSCEGHVFEPHAVFDPAFPSFASPRVSVAAPAPDPHPLEVDPDDARANPALLTAAREWRVANHLASDRLFKLLERFYKRRDVPFHVRLQSSLGYADWGCVDLHPAGAQVSAGLPYEQLGARLALYQSEMAAFAAFLREQAKLPA